MCITFLRAAFHKFPEPAADVKTRLNALKRVGLRSYLLGRSCHLREDEHEWPHQGEETNCRPKPIQSVSCFQPDEQAPPRCPLCGQVERSMQVLCSEKVRCWEKQETWQRKLPPPILTKPCLHKHPADALVNSQGPCGSTCERFSVLLLISSQISALAVHQVAMSARPQKKWGSRTP